MTRLYGWAPHDHRATGSVPRNHGKHTTAVAALTPDGLQVPWMIEGAMDTTTFAWYLPPYSPDFTPIEQAFSKIKAVLRRLGARTTEALWEAMRVAVEAITPNDAIAWFTHAGYALPAQAT